MIMNFRQIGVCGLLVISLANVTVEADEFSPGLTLNPQIGYDWFDGKRDIKDDQFLGLGVGYQFSNPWAVEFNYLTGETKADNFNLKIDFDQYRLDALYHFSSETNIQPYLALGLGQMDFESNLSDDTETQFNAGGGVKMLLNDVVSLRGDLRAFYGVDDDTIDFAATLGLFLHFGHTPAAPISKPMPVAQPQPADSDGDGVVDGRDRCPGTPRNTTVDDNGCIPDSDSDGVADNLDQCPGSSAGARVDDKGCYVMLSETRTINVNVKFANNSDVIAQEYQSEVQKLAEFMREYPQTQVVVEGHTDDRGAADYNQQLSERRAKSVANALMNNFNIAASRVSATGKGEVDPIADNNTAEGRAANRRVVGVVSATVETRAN